MSQKGLMNSSGRRLLETCKKNNLFITNATFKCKKSHITTWSAPYRSFQTWNGESRQNRVRNQIDYVIMRNEYRRFVTNLRAYGGIETETDYKLLKREVNFQWYKIKFKSEKPQRKLDIKGFSNRNKQNEYNEEVRNNVDKIASQKGGQEKWNDCAKYVLKLQRRYLVE